MWIPMPHIVNFISISIVPHVCWCVQYAGNPSKTNWVQNIVQNAWLDQCRMAKKKIWKTFRTNEIHFSGFSIRAKNKITRRNYQKKEKWQRKHEKHNNKMRIRVTNKKWSNRSDSKSRTESESTFSIKWNRHKFSSKKKHRKSTLQITWLRFEDLFFFVFFSFCCSFYFGSSIKSWTSFYFFLPCFVHFLCLRNKHFSDRPKW